MKTISLQRIDSTLPGLELKTFEPARLTLVSNRRPFLNCLKEFTIGSGLLLGGGGVMGALVYSHGVVGMFSLPSILALGAAFSGWGRIQDAAEADHTLRYNGKRKALDLVTYHLGIPYSKQSILIQDIDSIKLTYIQCRGCGKIHGRRAPQDPLVSLRLRNGQSVFCGDHDLEPVNTMLSHMGALGLFEEIRVEKAYDKGGLCPSCIPATPAC